MESERTIDANGISLFLREWNPAADTTVVLVHGYPDSSLVWQRCAEILARHFHVVAYDVRGAGQSEAPTDSKDYTLEVLSQDFAAVIEAVSPEKPVHLLAHDWGSIQAWEPVTDPAFAHRIASFTSVSGPCLDHAGHWLRKRLKGRGRDLGAVLSQLRQSWYISLFMLPALGPGAWKLGLDRLWPSVLKRIEGVNDSDASPTQRHDGIRGVQLYRSNMLKRLGTPRKRHTGVPVQLLVPSQDHFVNPALFDELQQWVPRLWRQDLDAGHWLPLSDPQLLAEKTRRFIDFVESGVADQDAPAALARLRVSGEKKPFSGKLAIVTGAGNGIGRETALNLAGQGAELLISDIDKASLAQTAELAQALGATVHSQPMDVGKASDWDKLAKRVKHELGEVDLLINNAGIGMAGAFLETSRKDWKRILDINLWSVIYGAQLFGAQMAEAGKGGTIVNVASAAAFSPNRSMAAYATSKAAVRMLSDCMRAELAAEGIQVITVCPGVINSGITDRTTFVGKNAEEQEQQRKRASGVYAKRNLSVTAVSTAIIDAITKGKDEVLIGSEAYGMNLISRVSPAISRRIASVELVS